MPLNFNIFPFNDDYSETKHFYRILFRPSVAVQARELTQAQTILQQQLTYLGNSLYQQGSMVIPGQIATDPKTGYVILQPTYGFSGITPIPINLNLLAGQIVQGETSGLQAQVVYSTVATTTDPPTIFVKYLNTGTTGQTQFVANEVLMLLNSTTGLAQVGATSPCGTSMSVQIDEGVYYVWGIFVRVEAQYLLLGKYTNTVTARVGLQIVESIITPEQDASLNDNAQGAPNYVAPGAYRYKIDLILTSKDLTDISNDQNFIELLRLVNSVTQKQITTDTYSVIATELAERMADTNGDFAVRNFSIDVRENLDTSFVTSGTALGGATGSSSATIMLATTASPTDSAYNGMQLYITGGSGAGQLFYITAYVGSTKTATLSDPYLVNNIADTTSTYTISDPTKVNRGLYPPPPFGTGDITQLAVGLESGRAYVDGYRIDTLQTTYVNVPKARDTAQVNDAVIAAPIGNFVFVKNLYNIPMAAASAAKNFLTINLSNKKASGSFTLSTDGVGTARVHSIEFYSGISAANADAVFKMFLFDVSVNTGADINSVRSFYLTNNISTNNDGNALNAYGDICTVFPATNVNGTGLVAGAVVTGPSGIGTELLVSYDAINNLILTEPNSGNTTQILSTGQFTAPSTTTGTIGGRTQIFGTQSSILIYPLPQHLVETVRASDNTSNTSYYARQMFEAVRNGAGAYIFNTAANAPFASSNSFDYLGCVVASSSAPSDVGKFLDMSLYITTGNFGGSPPNTTLTFTINSGVGAGSGSTVKLMATVYRTAVLEKLKTLTSGSVTFVDPLAVMSLGKADVVSIQKVWDSGDPSVAVDLSSLTHPPIDITDQYVFDTGQRDYYYDVGNVILIPNAPGPIGQVLITFTFFTHSGSGDYFSVDSYTNQVDYTNIPTYPASNGFYYALRDCLDFRPRKDDLDDGFAGADSSYSAPLSTTAFISADFQYYLGRIDKIYLNQYGNFNVSQGASSLTPIPPPDPIDGMMLYTLTLNPYTLSTTDLTISATNNPRYTMQAIGKLEQRIANLEYYTSLNQLEQTTTNTTVVDSATGLDRFQNGFIVDNFTGHSVGNVFDPDYSCSVDPTQGILRPRFIQNSNALIFNSGVSSNYVNRCNILMLPYTETVLIQQPFATDIININPFAVFTFHGDVNLNPASDTWYSTVQLPTLNVTDDSALANYQYLNQWSGTVWGDWQTNWVGTPESTTTTSTTTTGNNTAPIVTIQPFSAALSVEEAGGVSPAIIGNTTQPTAWNLVTGQGAPTQIGILGPDGLYTYYTTSEAFTSPGAQSVQVAINAPGGGGSTTTTTTVNTTQQVTQTRTGTQTMVVANTTQTVNNVEVGTDVTPYIRSRRIKVIGMHFKPSTQVYPYFDNTAVSAFCRPYQDPQITPTVGESSWTSRSVTWGGDYSPQDNQNEGTSTGTGDTGQTATYLVGPLNAPIITDGVGSCTLFFEIPCTIANEFKTGQRDFRLTTDIGNAATAEAYGDAIYTASGVEDQYQETITSVVTPEIITQQVSQSQTVSQNLGSTSTTSTTQDQDSGTVNVTLWVDPVAQSFLIKQNGGAYISSIDIFFQSTDSSVPVTMQIRNIVNGYPGQDVVPFSEKTLYPNNPTLSATTAAGVIPTDGPTYTSSVINISQDGSVPTTFTFDCPVYLNDGTSYAIVLIANTLNYNVYTAKLGDVVLGSTSIVSTPPYLGNLFKSQNASTWVADPTQNLKFTVKIATFDPTVTGNVYFTNSSVQPDTLGVLPFQTVTSSNVVRIFHPNHMMAKGQYSNSVVTISNVASGTYNGITDVQLTGTFSIDNVDLNSYTITVSGTPASGTGRVGPDGVVATRNYQYDSICPVINDLQPSGTSILYSALLLSGKSVNNNSATSQEPYIKDTVWTPLQENNTTNFAAPRMIASDINETTSVTGGSVYARKSFTLWGEMSTAQSNLSPQIDLGRLSIILPNNQIDDQTFENITSSLLDQGTTVHSSISDTLTFASQVILTVIAVTDGPFVAAETVTGAVSGAQGTVVSWDSVNLTLGNITGTFLVTEAISGGTSAAIGTLQSFQYVNAIINPDAVLDFSVFNPGYSLTIIGAPSNVYNFTNPVTILAVSGNEITVDTNGAPFVPSSGQANVALTQYSRYIAESGPTGCTGAARYITRQFNLANVSNSLHIAFTVNLPPGAFIDCYYRILLANSTQPFNSIIWQLVPLDSTVNSTNTTNPSQFMDYTYTANDIGAFTAFAIKLVMRGGNSAQIPRCQAFRAIALST